MNITKKQALLISKLIGFAQTTNQDLRKLSDDIDQFILSNDEIDNNGSNIDNKLGSILSSEMAKEVSQVSIKDLKKLKSIFVIDENTKKKLSFEFDVKIEKKNNWEVVAYLNKGTKKEMFVGDISKIQLTQDSLYINDGSWFEFELYSSPTKEWMKVLPLDKECVVVV